MSLSSIVAVPGQSGISSLGEVAVLCTAHPYLASIRAAQSGTLVTSVSISQLTS
jgi:hypothetical protein